MLSVSRERAWRHIWVDVVMHGSALPSSARLVLIVIYFRANNDEDREPWPSFATIADQSGLDPKTVKRWILKLEALGWLSISRSNGKSNRYKLLVPPGPKTALE